MSTGVSFSLPKSEKQKLLEDIEFYENSIATREQEHYLALKQVESGVPLTTDDTFNSLFSKQDLINHNYYVNDRSGVEQKIMISRDIFIKGQRERLLKVQLEYGRKYLK
jgi:hypothetical protein